MEDRSGEVWAVAVFFLILTHIFFAMRVYVRAYMLKSWGSDDWAMSLTLLIFTIYVGCQIGGVRYGTGVHKWDLTPENNMIALRYWYFCELFYVSCSCLLKVAIGIFLLRIATRPAHIWIILALIGGTAVFGTTYWLIILLQCRPIHVFWTESPGADTCFSTNVVLGSTYAASVITAFADWTFGILPIFMVWSLNMRRKAKIIVGGLLAFAAIGSTATIVRIPHVHSLSQTDDFLFATVDIAIWSTVEPGIGITAGCIATLRPLLQKLCWKSGLASTPASSTLAIGTHRPNASSQNKTAARHSLRGESGWYRSNSLSPAPSASLHPIRPHHQHYGVGARNGTPRAPPRAFTTVTTVSCPPPEPAAGLAWVARWQRSRRNSVSGTTGAGTGNSVERLADHGGEMGLSGISKEVVVSCEETREGRPGA